jgi:hypothetical protein
MKLPRIIQDELDTIPGRWTVESGGRHWHIRVNGQLAAIWPLSPRNECDQRAILNTRAQIRRAIRASQHEAGSRQRSGTASSSR